MILTKAGYDDQDGQLIRNYLKKPLRIGAMSSTEFFVSESDTKGGISANFLVECVAEQSITAPVVESVMVGTSSMQGVSFTCPGRILADRARSGKSGCVILGGAVPTDPRRFEEIRLGRSGRMVDLY
jgi:Protein of unknown function (DUF3124)